MSSHVRRFHLLLSVGCAFAWILFAAPFEAALGQETPTPTATPPPTPTVIPNAPFMNPDLPIEQRVDDLVSRMTLKEKVAQMMTDAPAIPRLGVPAYNWWNECLHGVAMAGLATVFPQSIGLGATWDTELVHKVAVATSDEARAKHSEALRKGEPISFKGLTFFSPNINIFRDPRWGRGQETYGEDPYLTSQLAVQFVEGLQGDNPRYLKLVSTPKHFAVHSGPEALRHHFDAKVDDRNLYETYLPAFAACVRQAKAYSVMAAYSAVNGEPCCSNSRLLNQILRHDWGFQGYVVSDCGAIHDIFSEHKTVATPEQAAARAVQAGCDLNCGDTYESLVEAVKKKLVTQKDIDQAVKRLFTARFKLGMFDPPNKVPYAQIPYSVVDSDAHRQLALQAARESIVLLKNDLNQLPLSKSVKTIAVIGPEADDASVMYGNYNGTPSRAVTPLEGIRHAVSSETKVLYAQGCYSLSTKGLAVIPSKYLHPLREKNEGNGLSAEYYNNSDLTGKPVLTRIDPKVDFDWGTGSPAPEINVDNFSVRWRAKLIPPVTGEYTLGTAADDGARLYVDGKPLVVDWKVHAVKVNSGKMHMVGGRPYTLQMVYNDRGGQAVAKLLWAMPNQENRMLNAAYDAASRADVCVMVLGISGEVEGEGRDRTYIGLPKNQEDLMRLVSAAGKPIILVLMSGSGLAVDWADGNIPAILECWYPGEEGGTAIADVIFGDYNPGGRLPITDYRSLSDVAPFEDYDVAAGSTYKYFRGDPLYPFGYGLSYTSFQYDNLTITPSTATPTDPVKVSVTVKNAGARAGDEVVQLYVTLEDKQYQKNSTGDAVVPIRALQGFRRVSLQAGESREIEFTLAPRQFARVDERGRHLVEPGKVMVTVGGGQAGVGLRSGGKIGEPLAGDFQVVGESTPVD